MKNTLISLAAAAALGASAFAPATAAPIAPTGLGSAVENTGNGVEPAYYYYRNSYYYPSYSYYPYYYPYRRHHRHYYAYYPRYSNCYWGPWGYVCRY